MKRHTINSILMLFMVWLVINCTPRALETTVSTPSPIVTVPPATTAPPATGIVTVTVQSLQVGATYLYADGSTLVAVPAGEFTMGGGGADQPAHRVNLSDFWIYSTKVTNQQYAWCESLGQCSSPNLTNNPSYRDNTRANEPIVGITYDQAVSYCSFVHGRLPTEAEWEKAARGPEGSTYPWGNAIPSCDLLNFNNCTGNMTSVVNYLAGASYYGALDMAGNAFEWVSDWYDPNYYNISPSQDPQGPETGVMRSVRSSTYASNAAQVAVTNRFGNNPENQRTDIGFRCAVADPTYFAPFCESVPLYRSDAGGASSLSESCPVMDIKQSPYCVQTSPITDVTFSGPPDATIDASSCTPSNDPNLFTCQSQGTIVSITAACQFNLPEGASCGTGFSLRDNACVADGGNGQCLAGWNYDASARCCTPGDGQDSVSAISVCPVGSYYAVSKKACLPYPVKGIVTISQQVGFASCNLPSGGNVSTPVGGGNSCQPQECSISTTWDPILCCCTADGKSCS